MTMNGAEALLKTLIDSDVDVCFANPGTSEMQLVAAIDNIPGMRPILCLFEGVATGAADGYGRMANKPAATLLHLGSGFANGMANLHNAKRAHTPIVNIIGDHAVDHLPLDSALTSDVAGHARLNSDWVRTARSAESLANDGAEAVVAAMDGRLANLIVPADLSWSEAGTSAAPQPLNTRFIPAANDITRAANALKNGTTSCLYLGGETLQAAGLALVERIAAATHTQVISEVFPARIARGHGRFVPERLPYFGEQAAARLHDIKQLICLGATPPVSFFAYPGKPSQLWNTDCEVHELASARDDQIATLQALVELLEAPEVKSENAPQLVEIPGGPMTAESVAAVVAQHLPEQAIVSDESATSGAFSYTYYDGAAPHDWLTLTGGAIGQGLPVALGAAVACPGRKVVNLQADGSAMYTNQSLWTMARENLDVCVVIFNNSSYAILNIELMRVGVENPGEKARSMLDLSKPNIDWTKIAEGMGVSATRATSTQEFEQQFKQAMQERGPRLIEVII